MFRSGRWEDGLQEVSHSFLLGYVWHSSGLCDLVYQQFGLQCEISKNIFLHIIFIENTHEYENWRQGPQKLENLVAGSPKVSPRKPNEGQKGAKGRQRETKRVSKRLPKWATIILKSSLGAFETLVLATLRFCFVEMVNTVGAHL